MRPRRSSRAGGSSWRTRSTQCGLDVAGRRALDVGASTGGFTDCLLQHGVREVVAVDVGYGTLDYRLRIDPRVSVMERTNARALTPAMIPPARVGADTLPDLAGIDVSFISLGKVLGAVFGCLEGGYDVLALVKPQFELGRGRVGKGGVVRGRRRAPRGVDRGGRGGAGAGRGRARRVLLGAAWAEGQPRELPVADRPGRRARVARAGGLERMAAEVEPVAEVER